MMNTKKHRVKKMELSNGWKYYVEKRKKFLYLFGYWDIVMDNRPGSRPALLGGELRLFDTEGEAKDYIDNLEYEG